MVTITPDVFAELARSQQESEQQRMQQDAERSDYENESRRVKEEIAAFVTASRAVPVPVEIYALWLALWVKQGGTVSYFTECNYAEDNRVLMPTRSTDLLIPTAYGAQSISLLIVDRHVSVSAAPTSGDDRPGWEWGHSTVMRVIEGKEGLEASTNNPRHVVGYPDVTEVLHRMSSSSLERVAARIITTGK